MELFLMLDNAILDWFQIFRCEFLDIIMPLYSSLGNYGIVCVILGAVLLCFAKTRRAGFVILLAQLLCLVLGNMTLKPIFARIRPYDANGFENLLIPALHDFSFPSGHTFSAFATAISLYFYHKKACFFALFAAFLMAFSRLYLYVHYPSDVLAGALVGIFCALLAKRIVDTLSPCRIKTRT